MNEQTMIDLVNKIADNDKVAPFQNGFVVLTNQEMVKLVELIVRESIDCLKPLSRNHSMVGAAMDTIREHFGVEE